LGLAVTDADDKLLSRAIRVVGFARATVEFAERAVEGGYATDTYMRQALDDLREYIKKQGFDDDGVI
jgi:hypothetical protein